MSAHLAEYRFIIVLDTLAPINREFQRHNRYMTIIPQPHFYLVQCLCNGSPSKSDGVNDNSVKKVKIRQLIYDLLPFLIDPVTVHQVCHCSKYSDVAAIFLALSENTFKNTLSVNTLGHCCKHADALFHNVPPCFSLIIH